MHMVVDQFNRFCKMIPVCNNYFRIIFLHRDDHWFAVRQGIDLFTIYNCSYLKKAEKSVVLPGNNYMILCRNIKRFDIILRPL